MDTINDMYGRYICSQSILECNFIVKQHLNSSLCSTRTCMLCSVHTWLAHTQYCYIQHVYIYIYTCTMHLILPIIIVLL